MQSAQRNSWHSMHLCEAMFWPISQPLQSSSRCRNFCLSNSSSFLTTIMFGSKSSRLFEGKATSERHIGQNSEVSFSPVIKPIQCLQNVCKHGRTFGSLYTLLQYLHQISCGLSSLNATDFLGPCLEAMSVQKVRSRSLMVTIKISSISSLVCLRIYAVHSRRTPVEFRNCGRQIFAAEKNCSIPNFF